jgi:hypothetical protein
MLLPKLCHRVRVDVNAGIDSCMFGRPLRRQTRRDPKNTTRRDSKKSRAARPEKHHAARPEKHSDDILPPSSFAAGRQRLMFVQHRA